jgi:tRNA A-37 threonylcarbamoyl transferase component Bud32
VLRTVARCGICAAPVHAGPVAGGVSSDVWRVQVGDQAVCVKRALPKLKVDGDWFAPVERSRWEAAWTALAGEIEPAAVCGLVGADPDEHAIVLEWLDASSHRVWKQELMAGTIGLGVAAEVGRRVARLHAGFVAHVDEFVAAEPLFDALRIAPYLGAVAARHPSLGGVLESLADRLAASRITVIHGDVSPKNILVGERGPILLDAECASAGDPAFDLAFCANHLLLKAAWRPAWADRFGAAFDALVGGYLLGVTWEPAADVDRRSARLLPALALARVDGLSPVEYLSEDDRERVRALAIELLVDPAGDLASLRARWLTGVELWR